MWPQRPCFLWGGPISSKHWVLWKWGEDSSLQISLLDIYPGLLPTPPQILGWVPCLGVFLIRSYTIWEPQSIGIWPPGLCSWVGMMKSLALPAAVAFVTLARHVDLFLRISIPSWVNRIKRDLPHRVRSWIHFNSRGRELANIWHTGSPLYLLVSCPSLGSLFLATLGKENNTDQINDSKSNLLNQYVYYVYLWEHEWFQIYIPEKPSQSGWNAGELQLVGSYTTEDSVPPQDVIT